MKHVWLMLAMVLAGVVSAKAQTAADLNEGFLVVRDHETGVFTLSWWGQTGRTYFIQTSADLMSWTYLPIIESGVEDVSGINFTNTEVRQFWRLRHTDAPTGGNAETADFDGDNVQNLTELNLGTDPLSAADTDDDGIADDWEIAHFGTLTRDSSLDTDGDGVSDHDEWVAGTDPQDWRSHPGATAQGTVMLSVYTPVVK